MRFPLLKKWLILEGIGVILLLAVCVFKGFGIREKPNFQSDFQAIFDGRSLEGWEYDPNFWSVQDGEMVGEIHPGSELKANTFIIWEGGELSDFELKLEFWISESGNSGIQYRSERVEGIPFALRGYQSDMDGQNRYTGQNYEERKRTTLAYIGQRTRISSQPEGVSISEFVERNAWKGLNLIDELGDREELSAQVKKESWNSMHLIIRGNNLQHYVNGHLMSEVHDEDEKNRMRSGLLGFQVHVGPPMKVKYRNIQLKRLP